MIAYEYYASLNGYIPERALTLSQHQELYYDQFVDGATLVELASNFYQAYSGLTPAGNYTTQQHVDAYYAAMTGIPGSWRQELKDDTYALLGFVAGGGTNLFTANFGANF